jgi:putative ABC transport system permease protein
MRPTQWLRTIPLRLRSLFRREDVERDLNEELYDHLEQKAQEYAASGLTIEEARRQARREFEGIEQSKENCRDARRVRLLESLLQDIRFGFRMLRKNPGFTLVAALTLALGIGANTAIFSAVYTVLLKALPYPRSERLVMVYENVQLPNYQNDRNEPSPGNFSSWRQQNTSFEDMAAYRNRSFNLTGAGEPLRVEGELVSAGFFSTLRTSAALGRVFTADDDRPGNAHVVVMSNSFWKTQFGSDTGILGKKILLDGESYAVVGVMPPGFQFPDPDDQLWVPLALSPADLNNRGSHYLLIFARLKPRVTLAQSQAEMNLIARHLTELYPDSNSGQTVTVVPLQEDISGRVRPVLLALLVAVGLTLLIVCANVANLLLARASVRHREIAVRLALGAGRTRILSQLLTESLLLAALGCALGLLLARWGVGALKLLAASGLPRVDEFSIRGPVLAFTLGISIFAALAFGLVPALQAARGKFQDSLKAGARESAMGSRLRMRNLLVVLETALGVIVVIGAGLMLRSFLLIEQVPLGFQPQGVLSFRVIPRGERYSLLSQRVEFYRQAVERLNALPGVHSAAAVSFIPLTFARGSRGFTIEGRTPAAPGQIPMAGYDVVTPGYFATMHIPLLEGKDFSWTDSTQSQPIIVINKAMADTYWPGEDPLGKRIRQGGPADDEYPWLTIAGVVGNVREFSPANPPRPTMYFPITQLSDSGGVLRDWVVRTSGDPLSVASGIPGAIWDVDKDLPVTRLQTMEEVRSKSVLSQRLNSLLFGLFAALALVLAAVGLYGVTSYGAAQRTREMGIRLALGAQARSILWLLLGQGLRLALVGAALGVAASLLLTRYMSHFLFGISPRDPQTFLFIPLLLCGVALLACYLPARRALRADPLVALRYE